jgi:hypothetical protein
MERVPSRKHATINPTAVLTEQHVGFSHQSTVKPGARAGPVDTRPSPLLRSQNNRTPWSFPPLAATLNKVLKSYAPGRITARAFLFSATEL